MRQPHKQQILARNPTWRATADRRRIARMRRAERRAKRARTGRAMGALQPQHLLPLRRIAQGAGLALRWRREAGRPVKRPANGLGYLEDYDYWEDGGDDYWGGGDEWYDPDTGYGGGWDPDLGNWGYDAEGNYWDDVNGYYDAASDTWYGSDSGDGLEDLGGGKLGLHRSGDRRCLPLCR